jgi:hypothetical protein
MVQPGGRRTFTPQEAEALLPEVDRLLAQAQQIATRLAAADRQLQAEQRKVRTNGQVRPQGSEIAPAEERQTAVRELSAIVKQVQNLGVLVRDIRTGLVDFPSLRGGREVYLCWRRGEAFQIRWWHETTVGFAGRQPLEEF